MSFSMGRYLAYGFVDAFFVSPTWRFHYWGFSWIEPLSGAAMHGLFAVLMLLGVAIAVGFYGRIAALLFAIGFSYLQLLDVANYLNHYYLAALLSFLLAASPASDAYSIDALRRGAQPSELPIGWLWIFRLQIGVVYTFAGLAKLEGDWLIHAQPLSMWLGALGSTPVIGPLFAWPGAPLFMSWAGFLFDTSAPWLLLHRRTRPLAYALVLIFHAITKLLFPIGMFPIIMIIAALVFFPPSWPRALLVKWPKLSARPAPSWPRVATIVFAVYALVQIALPLRHWAYGRDVLWDEQGMRFSWRVMVREKNGRVTYKVTIPSIGKTQEVDPARYLTRPQLKELAGQPDLILQLAHHVRDDFEAQGYENVEVRADTLVSLNGRRAAPLIDPRVDLAKIDDSLASFDWVLPAPKGDPPELRATR